MAATSMMLMRKPRLLLQAAAGPNFGGVQHTISSSCEQIRTFSSSEGGGGGGEGFHIRRPGGGGGGPSSDGSGGGGGGGRGGGFGGRRRGGGFRGGPRYGGKRAFNFGGAQSIGTPMKPPGGVRTHLINLSGVGNYGDAGPKRVSSKPIQDEIDEEEAAAMDKLMADLHKQDQEYKAQKERWIQNSMPPVRVPVIDQVGRSFGRGARKTAHSGVWITPGFGNVTVNRMDIVDYFPRFTDRELLLEPFVVTQTCGKFDVQCQVRGGGKTGQAGAIRLGVARALQHWNPEYRPPMKKMGFLTRDSRRVERKKVGKVKARKSPQWNRR